MRSLWILNLFAAGLQGQSVVVAPNSKSYGNHKWTFYVQIGYQGKELIMTLPIAVKWAGRYSGSYAH